MDSKNEQSYIFIHDISFITVNCDPCDSTETLPQPSVSSTQTTGLQSLDLASLPALPDPSCGYRPVETPYQDALIPEQTLDLGQAFMASQMSDVNMSLTNGMQEAAGSEVADCLIERWVFFTLYKYKSGHFITLLLM